MKKLKGFFRKVNKQKVIDEQQKVIEFKEKQIERLVEAVRLANDRVAVLETKCGLLESERSANAAVGSNSVLSEVQHLLVRQTAKGIKKYGTTVRTDSLSVKEWIDHALEEQADNMVYLTALKLSLEDA